MENIRRGTYRLTIGEIRKALAAGEKERAAKLKKTLPAFTPQATYTKKRLNPYITGYNQLVILDIDHVGKRELERIAPLATEAPYTVAYFRSPSGDGAKLIAYAATSETATPGNHRRVYEAVSRWYATRLDVELDTSGSDIGRLCFVSDDPALYLSPAYRPWLEGTGEVPEGLDPLPLTWKEEVSKTAPGTKKRKMASPLEKARRTAERKGAYAEGNRNNFIFVMATRANRLGVKQAEMEAYAATAFADLPADERLAAIRNAYSHVEEHAAEKGAATPRGTGRGSLDVAAVEAYISERFLTRKNEVRGYVEVAAKEKRNGPKPAFQAVSDYWVNTRWRNLQKAGYACSPNDLRAILLSDFSETYHPFRSYFEGLAPWDGVTDWIGQLADTVDTTRPAFWRGEKYWFSGDDIRKINENNETFRQRSPEEELFFTYFRKPERFDTPQYLTASDIMAKLSTFARITPTRSSILTLSKVLKKQGFKLKTIRGKRLFEVVELTAEQVKANFLTTPGEKETNQEEKKDHTDNQNITTDSKLPF